MYYLFMCLREKEREKTEKEKCLTGSESDTWNKKEIIMRNKYLRIIFKRRGSKIVPIGKKGGGFSSSALKTQVSFHF